MNAIGFVKAIGFVWWPKPYWGLQTCESIKENAHPWLNLAAPQRSTFVRHNMAAKLFWHFCQNCLKLLKPLSEKIWMSKLSNIIVKIAWHYCQNCLTQVWTLLTLLSDKIWLSILSVIFVKIVWHMFWHFSHFCQRKYGCRICLIFLSKLSDKSLDTFDTFVRQTVAVDIVCHFCPNCLTKVLSLLTLLSDKIVTKYGHNMAVKIVWHFCQTKYDYQIVLPICQTKCCCQYCLKLLSDNKWLSIFDTFVRQNIAV